MSRRFFDHVDLRVRDRERATEFYRALLPAIGFSNERADEEWVTFYAEGEGKPPFFGLTEDKNHTSNNSRIAFWAESREDVNRLAAVARHAGALNIEGPQLWLEYSAGYYAVFFEDPDGNKLEVCCRKESQT